MDDDGLLMNAGGDGEANHQQARHRHHRRRSEPCVGCHRLCCGGCLFGGALSLERLPVARDGEEEGCGEEEVEE